MEESKNRSAALGRLNMAIAAVYEVASVALIAIIVFGDVANANDSIKRLVAFSAVMTSITAWIFTSNALKASENAVKDMSAEEAATVTGKSNVKQPWMVYQIYALGITVATIAVTLTAIY
jgi:NADH:ubiquinone oxidoreductase subunit 4 (subunit M)